MTFKQLEMNPVEMKIGILQAGRCPDELCERHGDYDGFYTRLLDGNGFEFETWPVLDGVFPAGVNDADGWIVTGSKFGAYEDHDWIPRLEDFLRAAFAAAVPIVGICFGHQILAQALGGKVEKFSGGWSVGVENYAFDDFAEDVRMIAWHQDQVTELPPGASVVGSSDFCRYAALAYDDRAYTIQAHPEFEAGFVSELIEARRNLLPENIATRGINSLAIETSSTKIAEGIVEFFKRDRTPD